MYRRYSRRIEGRRQGRERKEKEKVKVRVKSREREREGEREQGRDDMRAMSGHEVKQEVCPCADVIIIKASCSRSVGLFPKCK